MSDRLGGSADFDIGELKQDLEGSVSTDDGYSGRFTVSNDPNRELTVSTFIHLMGLPSQKQLALVEAKLDSITNKISALSSRVDRLSQQLSSFSNEPYLDRIDFQISDLRNLIKKIFLRSSGLENVGVSNESIEDSVQHKGEVSLSSDDSD